MVGLDIEWKPNVKPNTDDHITAVIQLFDGEAAYVFHVCHFNTFPTELMQVWYGMVWYGMGVGEAGCGLLVWDKDRGRRRGRDKKINGSSYLTLIGMARNGEMLMTRRE